MALLLQVYPHSFYSYNFRNYFFGSSVLSVSPECPPVYRLLISYCKYIIIFPTDKPIVIKKGVTLQPLQFYNKDKQRIHADENPEAKPFIPSIKFRAFINKSKHKVLKKMLVLFSTNLRSIKST